MSGPKPEFRDEDLPSNPACLVTQNVPAVCLRLQSHRQQIALPYVLLLRVELAEDATNCLIDFATHEVRVRGRHLRELYVAISQGLATEISIRQFTCLREGTAFLGPYVTEIRIKPTDESGRVCQ